MNQQSLQSYLDELSSSSATPGGGAVAALTGAQAAALVSMVCNLTKRKTADNTDALTQEIKTIKHRAEQARAQFDTLADEDIEGFKLVMAAYKLPKTNPEERSAQQLKLQIALKQAAHAPLETAVLAGSLSQDILRLSEIGNKNLITDVGIAALLVPAAIQSARMNVLINLSSMQDEKFKQTALASLELAASDSSALSQLADSICTSLLE